MGYPHYSGDCDEYQALVRDFGYPPDRSPHERPEIVVLCGSTRFKDEINRVNAELTMQGKIVLSMGVFGHVDMPDRDWTTGGSDDKRMLDDLHKRKIDLADRVLVLNVGGYIGESTRSEIVYAQQRGRPVEYLESEGLSFTEREADRNAADERAIPEHEHEWADIHGVMGCGYCRIVCPDCGGTGEIGGEDCWMCSPELNQ